MFPPEKKSSQGVAAQSRICRCTKLSISLDSRVPDFAINDLEIKPINWKLSYRVRDQDPCNLDRAHMQAWSADESKLNSNVNVGEKKESDEKMEVMTGTNEGTQRPQGNGMDEASGTEKGKETIE